MDQSLEARIAEIHQDHYKSCNCLGNSERCCNRDCYCRLQTKAVSTNAVDIGRMALYVLSQYDAERINRRRGHAEDYKRFGATTADGHIRHIGVEVEAGRVFPMLIVTVNKDEAGRPVSYNGQVFLDGNDTLWVVGVWFCDDPQQGEATLRV